MVRAVVRHRVRYRIRPETRKDFRESGDVAFFVIASVSGILRFSRFVFPHQEKLEEFARVVLIRIALVGLVQEIEEFRSRVIPRSAVIEQYPLHHGFVIPERMGIQEVVKILHVAVRNVASVLVHGKNILEQEPKLRLRFIRIAGESVLVIFRHVPPVSPIESRCGQRRHFGIESRSVWPGGVRKNKIDRGGCGTRGEKRVDHGRRGGEKRFSREMLGLVPRPIRGSGVRRNGESRKYLNSGKEDCQEYGNGASEKGAHTVCGYEILIGNERLLSILPNGGEGISGDERNENRGGELGIPEDFRSRGECFFTKEIRYGEDEEKAKENSDSEREEQRKRPCGFSERKEDDENSPSERAGSESGEKTGKDVPPTGNGANRIGIRA